MSLQSNVNLILQYVFHSNISSALFYLIRQAKDFEKDIFPVLGSLKFLNK